MTIEFGGSGITQAVFDAIVRRVPAGARLLEIGSGHVSTPLLAQRYRLTSVEDNLAYVGLYQSFYVYAPLENGWYSLAALAALGRDYAAILVDGPAGEGNRAQFAQHLDLFQTGIPIFIDDTWRISERDLARDVADRLNKKPIWFDTFAVIPP